MLCLEGRAESRCVEMVASWQERAFWAAGTAWGRYEDYEDGRDLQAGLRGWQVG